MRYATGPGALARFGCAYGIILGAKKRQATIDGPGGKIRFGPRARGDAGQPGRAAGGCVSVLFEQGRRGDREPCGELEGKRVSVWYDAGLIAGQPFREVLRQRIETVKAVVVLWTENSIGSKWVRAEANLADSHGKLICLRDPG